MRKGMMLVVLLVLAVCMAIPSVSFTEDADTVLLARTIYALAGEDGYDAKLAVGTVVMNRVENAWFGSTLGEVLEEQHQFPYGRRYDQDSLRAAHEVLSGTRTLDADVLYYQVLDASQPWDEEALVKRVGSLGFYTMDGND